ncbi:MAG: hypothetical protein DRJ05_06815 [Bacteroidetes bacterium]|nr:MAG: hypothetical protein DRJ05_06815 [Bacteroidota bacterium]
MHKKNIFTLVFALLGILSICNAQTKLINGFTFEKIDSKWYQLYYGDKFEVNESIISIKFIAGISENQKNSIVQMNNCVIIRSNSLGAYDLEITDNTPALEVVENFIANPSIEIAVPNTYGIFAQHANDTYYNDQWHLDEEIAFPPAYGNDAYKAWDKENGDPNIIIAVLDTGTDLLHEDLDGNIWVNPGEDIDGDGVVWDQGDINGIDDDNNGLVDDLSGWDYANNSNNVEGMHWHGTLVAGIAGAETNNMLGVAGVAGGWGQLDKGISMMICQIGNIQVSTEIVDDAIEYAYENGANVITLSILITPNPFIEDAINDASNNGCFVDCCSGNYPPGDHFVRFPAYLDNCFAVGATSQNGLIADFSCYGPELMVVAPGVDIYGTMKNNSYGYNEGTSFASPQVGATAGLILSRFPDFTPKDIEEVLCLTAMKLTGYVFDPGFEYGSWNYKVGYGKLNVDRALGIVDDFTSNTTLVEGNYIRDAVNVTNNSTLTLDAGSRFYLLKTGQLTVDAGASLIIEDDVTIIAKEGTRYIHVYGDISFGDNVKFIGEDGAQLKINLYNTSEVLIINNCEFTESAIDSDIASLTITNSEFNSGGIYGNYGDYIISNCDFDESFAHFPYTSSKNSKVTINSQCNFENSTIDAIRIFNYKNFEIKNCTINSSERNGIYLSNAGGGTVINEISDCEITQNNSTSYSGILLYNSTVEILDNYIDGNYYGIKCFNNSNTYIKGDPFGLTQQISNNTSYELFASYGNFPYYVKYNGFYDDDNPQPIIYYTTGLFVHTLDVRYNHWDANFNYLTDLYPASWYLWQPTWTPPANKSGEVGESLYFSAKQKIETEDYSGAKTDLMQVVKQDPQSHFAEAALRDIFEIEEYGENDFATLKSYYNDDSYVQATELLIRRGGFFANLCDVKLENWQNAIDWYENIIQYPPSMEDSIFAIIDLGHLYLLMEEGGTKSTYSCKMPEHQPKSVTAYNGKKDYLLSLIPGDQLSDALLSDLKEMKAGELLQNIPNPFNSSTQIWYKLNTDAVVSIEVFNTTGKKIQTFNMGNKEAGVNSVEFKPDNLTPGIYFYTIKVNGVVSDTKKMTLMK